MTEEFLQYVWKYALYEQKPYFSDTGEEIIIIHQGEQNFDSGPDFTNTKIKIGDTIWVGNCEVHLNTADWEKHGHTENKAYNNIILHVVAKHNNSVVINKLNPIPTIELSFDKSLIENYNSLVSSKQWVSCASKIQTIEKIKWVQWLTFLAIERLENKSVEIVQQLEKSQFHWEEAFYIFLARSFGFKVNSMPFELLAKSIPLNILGKHKNNLFQIEALFFGQSGLLENAVEDYSKALANEYIFLQKKYQLKPIEGHLWKFMRLRPYNFPTIRIAQFASLVHNSTGLFSKVIEAKNSEELQQMFTVEASDYWTDHFRFEVQSKSKVKNLTDDSIHILLINAVIPFIFVYGKLKNIAEQVDKSLEMLESLGSEQNSIIKGWDNIGFKAQNAFETQALLQLKNVYCDKKKCLNCAIGNNLIPSNL